MATANEILLMILYILGAFTLIMLIVLIFKLLKTVDKVNRIADDVEGKMASLNGLFNIIDNVTDGVSIVNDFIVDRVAGIIGKLFRKRKSRKERIDDYEE